jgi:hypothetical protein
MAINTATHTASNTKLNAYAASGSLSSSKYTAKGVVWVLPSMFPANVMVAPNSPSARAHATATPAINEGESSLRVTFQNRSLGPEPIVAADSS